MTKTESRELKVQQELHFRGEFRAARNAALRDSEAFHEFFYTLERIGYVLYGQEGDIGKYKEFIRPIAERSPLSSEIPSTHRKWHVPFSELYELIRVARNDAFHQGAYARNLVIHATQLALILEDALSEGATKVGDFMVREPVCAHSWQPVSFVRQQMLTNSFTYLPVRWETENPSWYLVSDFNLASYLRRGNRKQRMASTLKNAVADAQGIDLDTAKCCIPERDVGDAIKLLDNDGRPILVCHPDDPGLLLGIVTAFDLL